MFVDNSKIVEMEKNYVEKEIQKGMEYRPDLVAYVYLGDPNKSWMITLLNNFNNGIQDYTLGRKIKVPVLS